MESPYLYDPIRSAFSPSSEEFEAVEKSFIRRVRTGAHAVPILSDYTKYSDFVLKAQIAEAQDAELEQVASTLTPTEEAKQIEKDESSDKTFLTKLTNSLDNKHLAQINSQLMDMIEKEQQELKRITQLQKQHETTMKPDDKDANAVNALLLELSWHHREFIQNLQEIRNDSVHAAKQAHRLLRKVSKCVKKQ